MWTELVAELNGKKLTMIDHDRDTKAGNDFAKKFGFIGQPATVIYDAAGNEAVRMFGPSTPKEHEALVRQWANRA